VAAAEEATAEVAAATNGLEVPRLPDDRVPRMAPAAAAVEEEGDKAAAEGNGAEASRHLRLKIEIETGVAVAEVLVRNSHCMMDLSRRWSSQPITGGHRKVLMLLVWQRSW